MTQEATPTQGPLRVLFVCTANMCRSPLAAAVFKARLTERALPVQVASAGELKSGVPAHEHTIAALTAWDIDASDKVSRRMDPGLLRGSDLIIGMSTRHARRLIGEDPTSRPKIFLFKELVTLAERLGPRMVEAGQTPQAWISALAPLRELDYVDDSQAFEIPDPIGLDAPVYVGLREDFAIYSDTILKNLFPAR